MPRVNPEAIAHSPSWKTLTRSSISTGKHAAKLFEAGDLHGALKEIQHVEAASKDVLRLLDELGK